MRFEKKILKRNKGFLFLLEYQRPVCIASGVRVLATWAVNKSQREESAGSKVFILLSQERERARWGDTNQHPGVGVLIFDWIMTGL